MYGIPENAEGDNIREFIDHFIKAELSLPETELKIQRCHKALSPKPPPNANPRSVVVVYFQEYRIEELVLVQHGKRRKSA